MVGSSSPVVTWSGHVESTVSGQDTTGHFQDSVISYINVPTQGMSMVTTADSIATTTECTNDNSESQPLSVLALQHPDGNTVIYHTEEGEEYLQLDSTVRLVLSDIKTENVSGANTTESGTVDSTVRLVLSDMNTENVTDTNTTESGTVVDIGGDVTQAYCDNLQRQQGLYIKSEQVTQELSNGYGEEGVVTTGDEIKHEFLETVDVYGRTITTVDNNNPVEGLDAGHQHFEYVNGSTECGDIEATEDDLSSYHTVGAVYVCGICDLQFHNEEDIQLHVLNEHTQTC